MSLAAVEFLGFVSSRMWLDHGIVPLIVICAQRKRDLDWALLQITLDRISSRHARTVKADGGGRELANIIQHDFV